MDKLIHYQNIIGDMLKVMATRIPVNRPNQKKHLIINKDLSEYILVSMGDIGQQYEYSVLAHLELKDGKVYIYEENIDPSIYERLAEKGIPEADILPVYLPDYVYT